MLPVTLTRHFAPALCVQRLSRHALTLMAEYVLSYRRTIRIHRFYRSAWGALLSCGRNRRPFHPLPLFGFNNMNLFKNNRGATAVEFALVALPVLMLIFGIIQTGYVVWADNLLHISVDAAARCGAVNSATSPCLGKTLANMQSTATTVFGPLSGATFSNNATCSADGGSGLIGTYHVTIGLGSIGFNLNLTAKSCYPTVS